MAAAVTALALALLATLALPGAAAVEGDDGSGDATATRTAEAEPPRNRTLTIQLVDNATGEAAADVPVDVFNMWEGPDDERIRETWNLRTDANGTVSVNASDGPVRLRVDHPDWKRFHASFELDGNLSLELPLRPADGDLARIAGVVEGGDGGTIAGAQIEVDPVRDCEDDECPVRRDRRGTSQRVDVNGTEIQMRWQSHDRNAYLDADRDGRYTVAVPPGSYRIEAEAEDHLSGTVEVEAPANETTWANLTLTPIPPDSVTLEGLVHDAETGDPVPGAEVRVENPRWGSHSRAVTDADGRYQVTTKPGHVVVRASAEPGGRVCIAEREAHHDAEREGGTAETSVVEPKPPCEDQPEPEETYLPRTLGLSVQANETRNLSLELQPEPEPTATIQGWVLDDETGEPLADATVHLVNEETEDWGRVQMDENGSFSASVPAGYHTLRVRAQGHLENATNVDVEASGTAEVVLRAPPGDAARGHRCCYATYDGGSGHAAIGTSDEAGSDASAAGGEGAPVPADGPATIEGGPGDLGRYEASSGPDETGGSGIPAPGAALTAAGLLAAAVGAGLRGPRSR